MKKLKIDSYIICSTPRTGSTLLCEYLASTTVAGQPHSYFRGQDKETRARDWGILQSNVTFDFADYLSAARATGSTDNGIFSTRIMWETLNELTTDLSRLYPDIVGNDLNKLIHAFGKIRFVYLERSDVVAQAISLFRAERTSYWHSTQKEIPENKIGFDFKEINLRVSEINNHNTAWQDWFSSVNVEPHHILYEDLDADPKSVVLDLLDFLEIAVPDDVEMQAQNLRLADATTTHWLDQFSVEMNRRRLIT